MEIKKILVVAITSLFIGSVFAAEKSVDAFHSPVGYWKTIDDITGKPKSIVQVWRNSDQMLMAKVVKIFPENPADLNKTCTACQGDKHDQPIVGMVIMSGLKSAENQWGNGQILDPENGKTYKCTARLMENGKKLNVRGFIGLPMFGRSQTWERVDLMLG